MCIPELVFFDDDSSPNRRSHSRRRDAIRPLSRESASTQPLLSSPPFVVQVSPKLGRHHRRRRPLIQHQTAPQSQQQREDVEWREGFRAGREAVQKRAAEERKRKVEGTKEVVLEGQAKAIPEIVVTAPKPRAVSMVDVPDPRQAPAQPALQRATSAPQPTQPAPPLPPPVAPVTPPASRVPSQVAPVHQPQPEPEAYIYEHRRFHRPVPRHRSPSSDSMSSRSLRALKRRLSNIWAHVVGLERWAIDEDAWERRERRDRERREAVIRRTREREEAERRRRQGQGARFEDEGRTGSRGRRVLGPAPARRVVVVDERNRAPVDTWVGSRWNWERGL